MWLRPTIEVARAYKYAADELVKEALSCHEPHLLDYPIFYTYRHMLELYLKILLNDPPQAKQLGHDLPALIRAIEKKFGSRANEWSRPHAFVNSARFWIPRPTSFGTPTARPITRNTSRCGLILCS